jgi:hypothetical protein
LRGSKRLEPRLIRPRAGKPWKEVVIMINVRLLATGYVVYVGSHVVYATWDVRLVQRYLEVYNDYTYRFSY